MGNVSCQCSTSGRLKLRVNMLGLGLVVHVWEFIAATLYNLPSKSAIEEVLRIVFSGYSYLKASF